MFVKLLAFIFKMCTPRIRESWFVTND